MTAAVASKPDILLYTNHGCPWAHRAHIALNELGIDFKEEIIDLDRPRDPWYLEVNPVSRCFFQSISKSALNCFDNDFFSSLHHLSFSISMWQSPSPGWGV